PAEALLVLNPPPPDPWPGLDQAPSPPGDHLARPLHLGLLLELWSRGQWVFHEAEGDDPLLVLRCVGHERLGTAVISGIHRRSRRWGHRTLTNGFESFLPPGTQSYIEANTRDQTELLWDRHRLRLAYELHRDRYLRQREATLPHHLAQDIPPWMSSWLDRELRADVHRRWEHMVSTLEESCRVPLTDPRWDQGFQRLGWIEGCDAERWRRWHTGRPHGWSDAMLRQRAQQTFAQRLIDDIPDRVVCPTLPEAVSRMRRELGDDAALRPRRNALYSGE
ncbi:MAG: hypothetical protein VYE15_06840, partial [Myxococcota bacterium]|nr:hypothetical protein [Myxococcota bacterium]